MASWGRLGKTVDVNPLVPNLFPLKPPLLVSNPHGSPRFLPWTNFDRSWPLQNRNSPLKLQFFICSDPVVKPSVWHFKLAQILTLAHFPASNHQLWRQNVHLLPNISYPLTLTFFLFQSFNLFLQICKINLSTTFRCYGPNLLLIWSLIPNVN